MVIKAYEGLRQKSKQSGASAPANDCRYLLDNGIQSRRLNVLPEARNEALIRLERLIYQYGCGRGRTRWRPVRRTLFKCCATTAHLFISLLLTSVCPRLRPHSYETDSSILYTATSRSQDPDRYPIIDFGSGPALGVDFFHSRLSSRCQFWFRHRS
ncbi:hypothetical protein EVAR_11500_1 [Eumeta japonica]|uniref:Uncharacterized protein n=1 Tax=Eumeta variegata TaxID=151549 RepID=A0A4C1TZ19_EUMVA|nr:hypothetical protein EVAR_11500_1 [Eumeta japonica]